MYFCMFSPHQETLIVGIVRENNTIKLCEIQQRIIEDHVHYEGIDSVSFSTVAQQTAHETAVQSDP